MFHQYEASINEQNSNKILVATSKYQHLNKSIEIKASIDLTEQKYTVMIFDKNTDFHLYSYLCHK